MQPLWFHLKDGHLTTYRIFRDRTLRPKKLDPLNYTISQVTLSVNFCIPGNANIFPHYLNMLSFLALPDWNHPTYKCGNGVLVPPQVGKQCVTGVSTAEEVHWKMCRNSSGTNKATNAELTLDTLNYGMCTEMPQWNFCISFHCNSYRQNNHDWSPCWLCLCDF